MNEKQPIFINGRFLTQKISGVQRFAIEIVKEIKQLRPEAQVLSPKNPTNKVLAKELEAKEIGLLSGHLWEQIDLPLYCNKKNGIILNLCNTGPILAKYNLVTIHDLAVWDFPSSYSWKFRLLYKLLQPTLARKAKHIFTVSKFSKSRITKLLKVPEDCISIVQNAVSDIFIAGEKKPLHYEKKYILAVSSLDPKKNFKNLILAFNSLSLNNYMLIIIGDKSAIFRNEELASGLNNSNIVFSGFVEDKELAGIYSNAFVFVYPSLYEGFGIPPLEAMASGCPVLVSDIPALRETCGEAALYCNGNDFNDIKDKLELLVKQDGLRNDLIDKGYSQSKKFSWKKSASYIINRF